MKPLSRTSYLVLMGAAWVVAELLKLSMTERILIAACMGILHPLYTAGMSMKSPDLKK